VKTFRSILSICACMCAIAAFTLPVKAQVYDYLASPESGETFNPSPFRIYIPENIDLIRGVYFYVDPMGGDSRSIVNNAAFRDLVDDEAFALMGAQLSNVDMESGIGNGLLTGLEIFAQLSGHPELAFTNLYFEGYSWGGQFSYHFTKWRPDRVIGFVTMKGGYHNTDPAGDAIEVPGYMFIGELDLPYRIKNLTGIFEAHRPLGAAWTLAVDPGSAHQRITDRKLLDPFFQEVASARVPEIIPPSAPVRLQTLDETTGWLGNRTSHLIGSYECYDEDIGLAGWLIKRGLCEKWQEFVSDSTVIDTISCYPAAVMEPDETRLRVSCHPNPFEATTTIRFELPQADEITIEIFDVSGRVVRLLHSGSGLPGRHEISWDGANDAGSRVSPGIYLTRITAGAGAARQTVRAILIQ
jgi:FlgD Ig-like domain